MEEYLLDHYGTCDRDADCYWGRNKVGAYDGCLRTGWRGRACGHWHPLGVKSWAELRAYMEKLR